jgi:pimeloyl-ACP methyl ester carboxylesterase
MISMLITGALILLFISAALAPLEALQWWAGWDGDEAAPNEATPEPPAAATGAGAADHVMIYLSGAGAMSNTLYPAEELRFLQRLQAALPSTIVISDVFPYSVTNMGLTGERMFAFLWRWIEKIRRKHPYALIIVLLNLRNMFQVATSADARYGPIYNYGIARQLQRTLLRHGYRRDTPITLLGYSGGTQVALGVAPYLKHWAQAPIWVMSLGGVMADDPGLLHIEHLWDLVGSKDVLPVSGKVLFAGRWPIVATSPWNRAMRAGKITRIELGPHKHFGTASYFDPETCLPDGTTYREKVITTIREQLTGAGVVEQAAPAPGARNKQVSLQE